MNDILTDLPRANSLSRRGVSNLHYLVQRESVVNIAVFLSYMMISIPFITNNFHFNIRDSVLALGNDYYPAFFWKDPAWFTWDYAWWPNAISRGLNPFMTKYLWYPFRTDLASATSMPTLSLLMSPFTLTLGPVFSYNAVQCVTPALDGLAAYLLARFVVKRFVSSFLGGLSFGFSPYVIGQLPLHPHLSFVPLLPIGCLLYLKFRDELLPEATFVSLGALMVLAQAGVSLEMLAFSGVAAIVALLVDYKNISLRNVFALMKLGGLSAILLLPFIYYFFIIGSHVVSIPTFATSGMDLGYSILPLHYLYNHTTLIEATQLDIPELTLYISPWVVALLMFRWNAIDARLRIMLLCFVLICLHSPIMVFGLNTGIPNPLGFVGSLPVVGHGVLSRFSAMVWLSFSVCIAYVANRVGVVTLPLLLAVGISLMPNPKWISWFNLRDNFSENYLPLVPTPFFDDDFVKTIEGKAYIVLPYNTFGGLWQAVTGMKFRALGVYSTLEYSGIVKSPEMESLFLPESPLIAPLVNHGRGVIDSDWAMALARFCREHKIDGIIMDQNPWAPMAIVPVLASSGWTATYYGHVVVLRPEM